MAFYMCVCGPGGDPDPGLSRLEVVGLAGSHGHGPPPALGSGPGLAPGGLEVTGALWSWGGWYSGRQSACKAEGQGCWGILQSGWSSRLRGTWWTEGGEERWAGADCGGP